MANNNDKKNEKARVVIDIEDLREVTTQDEKSTSTEQPKNVRGAARPVQSTIMCPW